MHLTRNTLNLLVDGELSAEAAGHVREHLSSCHACDGAFQVAEAMRDLTREALLAVAEDVSFEKMDAQIATAIAVERPLGYGDRFKVWLGDKIRVL